MRGSIKSDRPIFLQIKEIVEEEVMSGELKSDEQIPSTNQIVAFYGVNPVTVLKGINMLTEEGIIYKKRGVGMFVSPGARNIILKKYKESFSDDYIVPLIARAKSLSITRDELEKMLRESWKEAAICP